MNWVLISKKTAFFIVTAVETSNLISTQRLMKSVLGVEYRIGIGDYGAI
jgi:hypothetical protein